jgi:hypothetical protein
VGTLYTHLRCRKKRRKKYGSSSARGQIPDRISIDKRPAIVEVKTRITFQKALWRRRPDEWGENAQKWGKISCDVNIRKKRF